MLQENAIEVRNVKKSFRIYKDKGSSLKEKVLFRERNNYEVRTVLKGISFDIKKGEAVGLVGHNGCGKSTTLKLLTQIIYPDSGSVEIAGRVSSLLELGAGFHPDMSGRDNIYINASIFGLTRKEIDDRLEEIIEFSELGHYIDNPVRTYSSGMYMRLAFSVAINVNADVILIDEILSVGDLNFQNKCMNKLQKIKEDGVTIVIVSHSMEQIESICDRSIWLNEGQIVEDDVPGYVHRKYLEFMGTYNFNKSSSADGEEKPSEELSEEEEAKKRFERNGNGDVRVKRVCCLNKDGQEQKVFTTGEELTISISFKVNKPTEINLYFGILRIDYMLCYGTELKRETGTYVRFEQDGTYKIHFPSIELLPSVYKIDIRLFNDLGEEVDIFNEATDFRIYSHENEMGMFRMQHDWINDTIKHGGK